MASSTPSPGEPARCENTGRQLERSENPQAGGAEIHHSRAVRPDRTVGTRGPPDRKRLAWRPATAAVDGIRVTRIGGRHSFPRCAPRPARPCARRRSTWWPKTINKCHLSSDAHAACRSWRSCHTTCSEHRVPPRPALPGGRRVGVGAAEFAWGTRTAGFTHSESNARRSGAGGVPGAGSRYSSWCGFPDVPT